MIRADPIAAATVVIAVVALAAAALTASASLPERPSPQAVDRGGDADLARCRMLGPQGGSEAACQAAWAEQRRRFFGGDPGQ